MTDPGTWHDVAASALSELLAEVAPEGGLVHRGRAAELLELVRGTLARLRERAPEEPWREEVGFALGRVEAAIRLARAPRAPPAEPRPVEFAWGKKPWRRR